MNLCRVCNVEDFDAPELVDAAGCLTPGPVNHRKVWEMAQAVRAMRRFLPETGARVLAVGAGKENTLYAMTNYAEVVATDLYAGGGWTSAPAAMLTDPAHFAPAGIVWNPARLTVQSMDARALRFADATFDAVFSSSSIEHFGSPDDICTAAREIGRVLKPGGVLALSTEFRFEGAGRGWPGTLLFDTALLEEAVVGPSGLAWIEPLETAASDATRDTAVDLAEVLARIKLGQSYPLPHVVMTYQGTAFTSVFIALRKPA
jgi:SAM-dependent methyltransferase